jgi:Holliday junction resolvase
MSTAAKRKGSKAELDVVKYLKENGWKYADRRLAGSSNDKGDVSGVNGVVFEVKNQARMDLAGWVAELIEEVRNAQSDTGAVIHKRKGKSDVGEWYATMPMSMFVDLIKKAGF